MLKGHALTRTSVQQISALSPVQRATLVQERRRLLSDLETVANEIEDTVRVGKARADCADDWTQDLDDLKFGAAALKRVEHLTDDFETEFSVGAIVDDAILSSQDKREAEGQTALQAVDAAAAALGMTAADLAAAPTAMSWRQRADKSTGPGSPSRGAFPTRPAARPPAAAVRAAAAESAATAPHCRPKMQTGATASAAQGCSWA